MTKPSAGEVSAIERALTQAYVFSKATRDEIALTASESEWVDLPDQSTLLREGEHCRSLFVLAGGKLIVKETVTQQMELIIARITPGDVVGELGFVDRKAASATVRTDGPASLVRIDYLALKELFQKHTHLELAFYRELTKTLADRLRRGNIGLRRSLLTSSTTVFGR